MSEQVYLGDYWPFFWTGLRQFQYSTPDGAVAPFTTNFYLDGNHSSMVQENYDPDGKFLNKWYMQIRIGFGVAEWRDDTNDGKVIVFDDPIGWGNVQDVPGTYECTATVDFFQSIPPFFGSCTQTVNYEELLPTFTTWHGDTFESVLVQSYYQNWNGKISATRYWLAKGVGPVATQFIIQQPDGSFVTYERSDAKVVNFNEQEKHEMLIARAENHPHPDKFIKVA